MRLPHFYTKPEKRSQRSYYQCEAIKGRSHEVMEKEDFLGGNSGERRLRTKKHMDMGSFGTSLGSPAFITTGDSFACKLEHNMRLPGVERVLLFCYGKRDSWEPSLMNFPFRVKRRDKLP
ncbi:hypothetical protein Salat_0672900 [Sesamum alatum]|uniref:Uncharacterized protein n=1 Tax=Sesamum alatum TaxID=300844 RepID=A0AAE2CUI0_9LAMI|nr:hypothetical protein Salat_0672900 [Sesamum alatum]